MTRGDFLRWNSGDDRRYELVDGVIVAMAPPSAAHGILAGVLARRVGEALDRRPPCTVWPEAGVAIPGRPNDFYIADLAVTCRPHEPGQQEILDPLLIIEILSPSTESHDRKVKLPDYRGIASVQEIVLVDQDRVYVEVHRRQDGDRWVVDLIRGRDGHLSLPSIGLELPLATLHAAVAFDG
jgi:Uma2 family endonuclease